MQRYLLTVLYVDLVFFIPPPSLFFVAILESASWLLYVFKGRRPCVEGVPKGHPSPGESAPQEEESQRKGRQTRWRARAGNSGRSLTGSQSLRPGLHGRVAHQAVPEAAATRGQEDEEGEESSARPREGRLPVAVSLHGALAPQACWEVWRHVRLVQRGDWWRYEWGRRRVAQTSWETWPRGQTGREWRPVRVRGHGLFGEGQ